VGSGCPRANFIVARLSFAAVINLFRILEEQLVEGQFVIRRKWGKGELRSFLCLARGQFSSQLTALTGLLKKGG